MKNFIIKHKFLFILLIFLFLMLIFSIDCFASEPLIVDGHDMSDAYTYFSPDDAFVIVDWGNYHWEYYLIVPNNSSYKSYCAISSVTSCLYYDANWNALDGHLYNIYKYNYDTAKFDFGWTGHTNDWRIDNACLFFAYASKGVYNQDHSTYYFEPGCAREPVTYPVIQNTAEDLATGTFNYIGIHPGTFSNTENIELRIYNITNLEDGDDVYSQRALFSTTLNSSSSYYKSVTVDDVTEFWYEIPRANLNIDFKNGNTYFYSLLLDGSPIQEMQATIGGLTEEDILNNNFDNLQSSIIESNKELQSSIDKQTEVLEENNKTNKNIFEKIGDILNYINPFSENFFAYKLVELLMDGLKGLFVPTDNFFGDYFDELNNWFAERLGFLYYPLELIFDLLDRILNINFEEPVIDIPEIKEPTTNVTFIKPTTFNFNSLLENSVFSNLHSIYFLIVDAGIYIGLVMLLMRKYEEVMTK